MNFNGYKVVTDDQGKVYPNTILIKKAYIKKITRIAPFYCFEHAILYK